MTPPRDASRAGGTLGHVRGSAEHETLDRLRDEIGARVRPFVSHLSAESVAQLIDRMAYIQLKYDVHRDRFGGPRTPPRPF
jgi:hypothetical protein